MKTFTPDELKAVLAQHKLWLDTNHEQGSRADLSGADLIRAYLPRADLSRANLSRANLTDADLTGANLTGADLTGAYLPRADLTGADLPPAKVELATGKITAFKKLRDGIVATLEIPAGASRVSSLVGRKCRAEYVVVVAISDNAIEGLSLHDGVTVYRVGEVVRSDQYDDDVRIECTNGIHFFITEQEAEDYN